MYKLIWFCFLLGLTGCTAFFFQPLETHYRSPGDLGLVYRDVYFPSLDGTRLHGWWLPAIGEADGSVLFVHGNAENISTHIGSIMSFPEQGFNVFLFDYRGYGRSAGVATLDGLLMDVEAGLQQMLNYDKSTNLTVFGQSLGAALGIIALANSPNKDKVSVLVADSSFTSFREIAREKLADNWLTWLIQWLLAITITDAYRPVDEIAKLAPTAVLLVHSKTDRVVPFHHSESLFDAANEPKRLWLVSDTYHNDIFSKRENQFELAKRIRQQF